MTSGEYEQPAGRHSQHPGTWTPQVREPHPPTHARAERAARIEEALAADFNMLKPRDPNDPHSPPVPNGSIAPNDPPAASDPAAGGGSVVESAAELTVPGLRKFDLGAIPASVTPPRSWRRAAWFAVGASLAVVAALFFAAAALMGEPRNPGTIDALPNYPSMPVFVGTSASGTPTNPARPPKPTTSGSKSGDRRPSAASDPADRPSTSGGPAVGTSAPTTSSPPPAPVYTPPVRETTPQRAFAASDPKVIGDRTELFYKYVTSNPDAAYQMTTGEMYQAGKDAFRARYSGIRSVQVRRIGIDPNQGTTVSEVKVTRADGSTFTEVRQLRFTSGGDPKISSEITH
jgi:hypothetical protein